jgi:hypothetical protein
MKNRMRRLTMAAATLALSAAARAELTYEVTAGVGHSDNITRVEQDEVDETLAQVGLDLDWREVTRRMNGAVNTNLQYVEYLDDTYDGELLGTADADITFGIVPDRFTWQIQDSFGQATFDPFEPVTPESRENVNYLTTGPDLLLRFGGATQLRLFGRYSSTQFERSPFDGERTTFGAALQRETSGASRVALNVIQDENEFDNPLVTPYDRLSAFLSYDLTAGRTSIAARAGYSWLDVDGEEDGGALLDLRVTRELSASTSLTLSLARQFTDSAESLRDMSGGVSGGGGGPSEVLANATPFEANDISLEWQFQRNRTGITLGATRNESDYEGLAALDRVWQSYFGVFTRSLGPTLELELSASLTQEDYEALGFDFDERMTRLSLDWQMSRRVGLRLAGEHYDRSSSNGLGEYQEARLLLHLTYSGGASRGAAQ